MTNTANDIIEKWNRQETFFEIQTSGSTGTPKKIYLKRELMEASACLTAQTFGLKAGDVAFCCLNVEYIAGLMMVVRALVLDLELVVVEPSANPLKNIDLGNDKNVFYAFVPLQLEQILAENPEKLQNAKAIIVGGTAVGEKLKKKLQTVFAPVFSTYSMTETITHVAIRRLNGDEKSKIFNPLIGVEIDIDERNCLKIKSTVTENKWIITNDVVKLVDGGFELLGRFDNVINSGGVKIQAEKIEQIITNFLINQRFFVAGLPDERLGQCLVLVIEGEENQQLISNLRKQLESSLSQYEMPKKYYFVPKFVETLTGKINKPKTIEPMS